MNGIADGSCLHHFNYLLEFLAAWEKRPAYFTPMAYQWCSAISEAAGRLGPSETPSNLPFQLRSYLRDRSRLRPQDLVSGEFLSDFAEEGFSEVGPDRDPVYLDATSHHTCGRPQHLTPHGYVNILAITLEIGFRRVTHSRGQSTLHLDHTSHHEWVFETVFSRDDDEVIADAVCVWIVGGDGTPPGSCARYLAKRVERDTPFSQGLRRASVRAIERIWRNELGVSGLETICWLNRLNVDVDDMVDGKSWARLLVEAIRSPMGPKSLTTHYWHLLDKLVVASQLWFGLVSRDIEVMRFLEKAEEWERLGVWMVVVWSLLPYHSIPISESMEGIEEVTLKLLLRRPPALKGLEDLCEAGILSNPGLRFRTRKDKLQWICDQARAGQSPSEPPPP